MIQNRENTNQLLRKVHITIVFHYTLVYRVKIKEKLPKVVEKALYSILFVSFNR